MKPTETLKQEHKIILLVLAAAEKQAKAIEATGKMDGDKILTAGDQAALSEAFEKAEAEEMGEGTHEKYHQLAQELAANR